MTTYECTNPTCPLGTVGQPGYFTAGITRFQLATLTGDPLGDDDDPDEVLEGTCPNCGTEGEVFDG